MGMERGGRGGVWAPLKLVRARHKALIQGTTSVPGPVSTWVEALKATREGGRKGRDGGGQQSRDLQPRPSVMDSLCCFIVRFTQPSFAFVFDFHVKNDLCLESLTAVCFLPFFPLLLCCPLTLFHLLLSSSSSSDHGQKAQGETSPSVSITLLMKRFVCL